MWSVIQTIILSILLIYIAHTFWNYMLQICTPKKKKNLVKIQNEKYASILQQFSQNTTNNEDMIMNTNMTEEDFAEIAADLTKSLNDL